MNKLNSFINYLLEHNSFYSEMYNEISLEKINVDQLPILHRRDIRNNYEKIISDEYDINELNKEYTNGTTEGEPLTIYKTSLERIGLDIKLWNIRRNLNAEAAKNYAFFYYNHLPSNEYKCINTSGCYTYQFPMKKIDEIDYVRDLLLIKEHKIKWLIGPPSIFYTLCCIAIKHKIKVEVDIIECISEYLPNHYEKLFSHIFNCDVYVQYSCHEVWGIAFGKNNKLELLDNTLIKIKNQNGNGFGKCLVTNLDLKSMPFVNYELSDLVRFNNRYLQTYGFRWTETIMLSELIIDYSFFDDIFTKNWNMHPLDDYQIIYNDAKLIVNLTKRNRNLANEIKYTLFHEIKKVYQLEVVININITNRFNTDIISGKMRGSINYQNINYNDWEFSLDIE